MAIIIKEVPAKKCELKKFINFATELYKDNNYFVPALVMDELNTLTAKGNPAFEFCESVYFMAYDDTTGKPVGRIAGIINEVTNKKYNERNARFGFIDFIDDAEVSKALIGAVEGWARSKGMTTITGPFGFTDMDQEGMLIEGFDQLGTMATIYNYPYYQTHIENLGYEKEVDWVEFKIMIPDAIPDKMMRIADIIRKKYNLSTPKYTSAKKLVADYGQAIFNLINEAYDPLYGYSPLTQKQIDHYIKMYVPILRLENVCLITEESGELIGVGITLPSMSKALQKSRGKMFPFGWWHMLKALRGKNNIIDLMLVAIKPEYQSKGVNALLFTELIPAFIKNGYEFAETNPELEVNQKVQSQWQYFDTTQHKRRRAYKKTL